MNKKRKDEESKKERKKEEQFSSFSPLCCFSYVHFVLICTVVVLYCFNLYCGGFILFCNVWVCVCAFVGFVMCGCFGNMYTVF